MESLTYKRIYGDWTTPQNAAWKKVLLNYSIALIQQYSYTMGKKRDRFGAHYRRAMDILYSGNVDGFCIVSSDSDFTRLAARFAGSRYVRSRYGGTEDSSPFIAACEKF